MASASDFSAILAQNIVTLPDGTRCRRKPRFYQVQIVRDATAGKTFTGQIYTQPGLPFLMQSMHAADTADTTNLLVQEPWQVQVSDNESGYQWTTFADDRSSVFGGREFGLQFPFEVIVRDTVQMTFTITNTASPTAGTATISLRGFDLLPI